MPNLVRAALGGSPKLHVTLLFLGERGTEDGIWEPAVAGTAGLELPCFAPRGVVGVPPRRPRLFALDLEDVGGHGAALHAAVSKAIGEPVTRPYWPHVTLLRVRKGRTPEAPQPPRDLDAFAPTALTLYRSHPKPHGSEYEVLARLDL